MHVRKFSFRFDTVPGNSAFVVPWDSTRGIEGIIRVSIAAGGAGLAPGQKRGCFDSKIIRYSIKSTVQGFTLDEQILTGNAGTSADWETQGAAGNLVAVAGTTYPREFKPLAPDHRLLVTAGGTAPTTLLVWGTLIDSSDFGS
jgi:hypothetical protein